MQLFSSSVRSRLVAIVLFAGVLPALLSFVSIAIFGAVPHQNTSLHECMEIVGSCIALIVALLLALRTRQESDSSHLLWVAAGLIAMGLIDGAHALRGLASHSYLRHASTLTGGALFALVWLRPSRFLVRRKEFLLLGITGFALAEALVLWHWEQLLPASADAAGDYSVLVKAINGLGGLGFIVAAGFFLRRYMRQQQPEESMFAWQAALFGTAALLFGFSHTWMADWWVWHGFRLLAYGAVLTVAYQVVSSLYQQTVSHAQQLERDIAERQRTAKLLQAETEASTRARQEWELTFNAVSDPVMLLDLEQRIVRANRATEQLLGLDAAKIAGRHCYELIHNAHCPPAGCPVQRMLETGVEERSDVEEPRFGKTFDVVATPLRNGSGALNGCVHVIRDVTERKQAEQALKASERQYRTLLNSLPQQIFVKDRNSRYVACNNAFAALLGIRTEEFAGKTDFDFFSAELAEKYRADDRRVMEGGRTEEIEEDYIREGQQMWVQTVKTPMRAASGEVTGVLGIFWDITEKKQAEISLQRVNRTLQAMNECADALMRATDETTMLQRVCDAAVSTGGYRMAWVGYAQHDASKTVRPMARAGVEEGYLEDANISWADVERGRGPTGTTIRTGKVSLCRDTMTDPDFAPWREAAIKRGYRSSIVLPLRSEKEIYGGLMIYAAEPRAFDTREQRLLEELANNVSYAIATLRARAERQKAQNDLVAERQRFGDVLDCLPAYVILLSPDYHVPFANKYFTERFGEAKGRRCYEYLFGRSEPCEICETYKVLKTNAPWQWKWSGPDGRHYDIHDFPFRDADGSTLILEMGIDITEREQAEAEVRKASLYTRSLLEASLDPLVTINRAGKITDVNQATEAATGMSREQLIGSDFSTYFTEPEQARGGYEQVFAEGFVHDYPLALRHISGRITDVLYNASLFKNEKGEVEGVFAAARDVTARNRAERALSESEDRYRSLVVATTQVVWTTSASGEVVGDMPMWRQFTGQSFEDIQGWGWIKSLHPEDRDRTAQIWSTAVANHILYETEYRMRRSDGEYRYVAVRGVPVLAKDGSIREWIGTCTDITERKQSEEEIRKLNDELEERVKQRTAELEAANKELEAFTYSVSHDLRAPLRHISGFSKILSEEFGSVLPAEAQNHLGRIQEGTRRMGALVDDLLNLARVGRQELRLQVTGLNSLVDEVIAGLKADYEGRRVEWKIGSLPFMECDAGLMRQVLQNLLSNALKFTRPRPVAIIEVGQVEQQGAPTIFVRDNGVGFSMKYADKLFGVFQRLHRAEDFEGTGVGLATVQRILHKHGANIWAESELDKGTTFYFTLAGARSEQLRTMATMAGGNS